MTRRVKNKTHTLGVRPLHDVFKLVDMKGGDKLQCWPWKGFIQPNQTGRGYPIWCWGGRRIQAHRVVYALKHGVHYDNLPQLAWSCATEACCNPDHIIERFSTNAKVNVSSRSSVSCESV